MRKVDKMSFELTPQAKRINFVLSCATFLLVAAFGAFFLVQVNNFKSVMSRFHPKAPHYQQDMCGACHNFANHACGPTLPGDCLECHEKDEDVFSLRHSELVLCTECHARGGYVAVKGRRKGIMFEVDLVQTHPYGSYPTEEAYPIELPLSSTGGMICSTCHDMHIKDHDRKMLRLVVRGRTVEESLRPLCLDCHHDNHVFNEIN